MGDKKPAIFSFGCGIGLDAIGAKEVFGDSTQYFGIDNCKWAITQTENYKNFTPKLPKTMPFDQTIFWVHLTANTPVFCFFNSLFSISENMKNLKSELVSAVKSKKAFYFVCDYTVNNTYHLPLTEQEFIADFIKTIKDKFDCKQFDILDGKGIIIQAIRR